MTEPRYSIIIPVRRFGDAATVLGSLRSSRKANAPEEIFVVEGSQPARQRNAALARAAGEWIVFLDNDCQPGAEFWRQLDWAVSLGEVEIVGGPVLLRRGANWSEAIFHALLAHPQITAAVASRYAARGLFRRTTQAELILCNMAIKREFFSRVGLFSPALYPNEENEWLDRATRAGAGIFYNPEQVVFRPQRASWAAFIDMLLRYGTGRTRQFLVQKRWSVHQLALALPFVLFGFWLLGEGALRVLLVFWLGMALYLALTCEGKLSISQRIVTGLAAPLVPIAYSLGQWIGFLLPRRDHASPIRVLDEEGRLLEEVSAKRRESF